jgi:hypothetical protein
LPSRPLPATMRRHGSPMPGMLCLLKLPESCSRWPLCSATHCSLVDDSPAFASWVRGKHSRLNSLACRSLPS